MTVTITSLTEYTSSKGGHIIVNGVVAQFPGAMVSIPVVSEDGRQMRIGQTIEIVVKGE